MSSKELQKGILMHAMVYLCFQISRETKQQTLFVVLHIVHLSDNPFILHLHPPSILLVRTSESGKKYLLTYVQK